MTRGLFGRWRGAAIAATALLVLCLIGPPSAAAARTLYVHGDNNMLAAHVIGSDGRLASLGAPIPTGVTPSGIAITPDGNNAYVVNTNSDNVSPYVITADGTVAAITPLGTGADPKGIAIAPDGDHLYIATAAGIEGFAISPGNLLSPFGATVGAGTDPQGLAITPDGRFLYAANRDTDTISSYSIAADGSLSTLGLPIVLPALTEPIAIAVRPSGSHLYVISLDADVVTPYAIGSDGTLGAVAAPTPTGDGPYGIAMSPDGGELYVANAFSDDISAYAIAANGTLTQLGAPVGSGMDPSGIATTPNGRFLFNSNFASLDISAYELTAQGNPIEILGSPFAAAVGGPDFQSLAIRPNQGPGAVISATAAGPGSASSFDASASTDPDGSVARYDWDFGDGTTLPDGGPTPTHAYAAPGTYTATVTVADNEGCSSTLVFTGQTAHCNGGPAAVASQAVAVADTTAPDLTLKVKKKQSAEKPIKLVAACDEPCELIAKGKIKLGKDDSAKAKKVAEGLAANDPEKLKLKLSGKNADAVEDAADDGEKITVKVKVSATDAAGNKSTGSARAKLK